MSQRKLSRVAAAGFLVALLTLPGAASARTAHRSSSFTVLEWLGSFWERGIALVTIQSGARTKQGYGIDPNGKPAAQIQPQEEPTTDSGTAGPATTGASGNN